MILFHWRFANWLDDRASGFSIDRSRYWRGFWLEKEEEFASLCPPRSVVTEFVETPQIFTGPRGGRYYKRTRVDGTTYREYTW